MNKFLVNVYNKVSGPIQDLTFFVRSRAAHI